MNKKKIIASALSLVLILGSFSACGNSKNPGSNNKDELNKAPDSLAVISDAEKAPAVEVTAITAGVDSAGNVVDKEGITDVSGHKVYSTGQKDSNGMLIYTTGKLSTDGKILYTKNTMDSFGNQIYYTGTYDSDGKLVLTTTAEKPDYTTNDKPSAIPATPKTTTSTIGYKGNESFVISDVNSTYVKYFGGSGLDTFNSVDNCKDGGYVTAGISQSYNGDLEGVDKDWSAFSMIVRYNASGEQLWKATFGGDSNVGFNDVAELKDGSIVAVGYTFASDTVAPKNSMNSTTYIVRVDKNGNTIWEYSFPGDPEQVGDFAECVSATPDGGFIVGGKASTDAGFFSGDLGKIKAYLFKFDKNCNIKWRRVLSGSMSNSFTAASVADNGDIYAICVTSSTDGDFSGLIVGKDYTSNSMLVKLNKKGELQWSKNLDGTGNSEFKAICALDDGCILGGNYTVYKRADGIFSVTYGKSDIFIMRCNEKGEVFWTRSFGGSQADYITGITPVEGGFAISGQTKSVDYDFQGQKIGGEEDGFVAYLNNKGQTCTIFSLDGNNSDGAQDICTLNDGTVIVCGWTKSNKNSFVGSEAGNQYKAYVYNFKAVSESK